MIPKINVLPLKSNININDLILIEDSQDNYSKKKFLISSLSGSGNEFSFIAGEAIAGGNLVSLGSDGKIYLLNQNNRFDYVGIAVNSGNIDETINVIIYGGIYSGLTVDKGKTYYIQDDGSISTNMTDLVAYKAIDINKVLVLY